MASAYKCDCCHKCYDPIDDPENMFITFGSGYIFKGKNTARLETINGGKFEEYLKHIDLCKDCSEKFISLLKSNKKEEKPNEKTDKTDDPLADFTKSVNDFLKDIGSRGTAILRDFVNSNSDSKTSERKSDTKQNGSD